MKVNTLIFFNFIFLYCISIQMVSAQEVSMDKTIDYLNHKFSNTCIFKVKNTKLFVDFVKNGEPFREDRVYLEYLEKNSVEYKADETAIIIKCVDDHKECIEREIFKLKIIRNYGRINLQVEHLDDKSIKAVQNAFVHLIRLVKEIDYK